MAPYIGDGFEALYYMNVFRILADVTHALSKCILIIAIHRNHSAEGTQPLFFPSLFPISSTQLTSPGVSLISQALYALVFCTRYIDLLWRPPSANYWNFIFKIFYILSSLYILLLMTRIYARTREREKAWRLGLYTLLSSLLLAPFVAMIGKHTWTPRFSAILVVFSLILESVCVLPQLLLLRQTTVPTVIDSYYLVALGAYRALYICNWIERAVADPVKPEGVAVVFGVLQTLLYLDFAWVYYTRQRVKLRAGGLVDAEDLGKSWVLRRVLGRRTADEVADEERPALGEEGGEGAERRTEGWGRRGISVSADEGVVEAERERGRAPMRVDAEMRDPDEMARILDEEEEEEESEAEVVDGPSAMGITGGEEWREGSR